MWPGRRAPRPQCSFASSCSFRRWSAGSGRCSRAAARSVRTGGEPVARSGRTRAVLLESLPSPARVRQDDLALRRLTHLSDEALVALVARGDESALGELYDRVWRVAYGIAYRVLRDDRLAEDAVQEGFLAAWRSAAAFRADRAKASTWIVTLVHRRAVDIVRREERRRAEPLEATAGQEAPDPTGSAENAAWLGRGPGRVQAALRAAPDAQREALDLADHGVRSQSELAES